MWRRRLGLPLLRSRSSSYQQQQHHHHLLPNPNEKPLALNLLRLFTSQAGSDSSSFIKPFIAFVLGGPGSGKGTPCSRIASNFGFAHLSAGDLLRNEISSGSEKGELILDIIKEGRIVPSEITVELIRKAMESSNTKRVLIDGFPRCEENRIAFERMIGTEPDLVIFFDCPEDEMVKRLLGRNQDRLKKLKSEHGKVQLGNITMDMVLGGMRGMIGMLWETSLLDPEEGIRFRGLSIPECQRVLPAAVKDGEPLPEGLLWLLLTGKVPNKEQVDALTKELLSRSNVPGPLLSQLANCIIVCLINTQDI